MALIYLSLNDEASSIIRRISWAFESPIPKTLEAIVLKLPMIMNKERICKSCKDHSKCEGCPFHRKGGPVSHISKIELEITDLESLKSACRGLGFTFQEHQKTYQWYGRWVGDSKLPEGILESDLGKCDHAIKVPDCLYEIGVVRKGTRYLLLWDSWHRGGLEKKIGVGASVLKQAYAVERVKREALRKKYRICEQNINNTIRLVLMV